MIRLLAAIPTLAYADLAAGLAFWTDALGFAPVFINKGGGATPVFAVVERDGVRLHLAALSNDHANVDGRARAGGGAVAFLMDGIRDLHRRCRDHGLTFAVDDLDSGKFGLRTFTIRDGEGNQVTFEEEIAEAE